MGHKYNLSAGYIDRSDFIRSLKPASDIILAKNFEIDPGECNFAYLTRNEVVFKSRALQIQLQKYAILYPNFSL